MIDLGVPSVSLLVRLLQTTLTETIKNELIYKFMNLSVSDLVSDQDSSYLWVIKDNIDIISKGFLEENKSNLHLLLPITIIIYNNINEL